MTTSITRNLTATLSTDTPPDQTQKDSGERLRLWTRQEYYQAAELGWFNGQRVELIQGKVYRKVTQNPPHATAIYLTAKALERRIGPDMHVRPQLPLPVLGDSDPEPDVLVVRGTVLDYTERHPYPSETVLIVEISDTTLQYDRNNKVAIYAGAGICDYWILNLKARTLEVYRDPIIAGDSPLTGRYQTTSTHNEQAIVTPLMLPDLQLRVADLLPPLKQDDEINTAR